MKTLKYIAISAVIILGLAACEKKDNCLNPINVPEVASPITNIVTLRQLAAPQITKAQKVGTNFAKMTHSTLTQISKNELIFEKNTHKLREDTTPEEWENCSKTAVLEWIKSSEYKNIDINQSPKFNSLEELKTAEIYNVKQMAIIQEIISLSKSGELMEDFETNITNIENRILLLSESERQELLAITAITKGVYDVIFAENPEFEVEEMRTYISRFLCGLTASGIGTIYGAVAGGIVAAAGFATGGVSTAVGLIIGAAFGAAFCK